MKLERICPSAIWSSHGPNMLAAAAILILRAFDVANRIGDLTFAAIAVTIRGIQILLTVGDPLVEAQSQAEKGLEFAKKCALRSRRRSSQIGSLALIRTLRGLTHIFGSFNDDQFDEAQFERHLQVTLPLRNLSAGIWLARCRLVSLRATMLPPSKLRLSAQRLAWTSPSSV